LRLAVRLTLLAMRISRVALNYSISRINRRRERRPRTARPGISDRTDDGEWRGATWQCLATA
jgi:hypothetical protein